MSPYLFLLCAEGFSALEVKVASSALHGIWICVNAPVIHHLLFADDNMLYARVSSSDCHHIQEVLHFYEFASGQNVNFGKSNIVFSKNVKITIQIQLAASLGVAIVGVHEEICRVAHLYRKGENRGFCLH